MQMHSPIQSVTSVGIRGAAIADLEARLKQDVLREAAACGGRILVHREHVTENATQSSTSALLEGHTVVEPFWCVLPGCLPRHFPMTRRANNVARVDVSPDGVRTTSELCDELQVRVCCAVAQFMRVDASVPSRSC